MSTEIAPRILTGLELVAIALVGLLRLLRRLRLTRAKEDFAREYFARFQSYLGSGGSDTESYGWLIHRSVRMQEEIGSLGIMAGYRPAAASYVIRNYPVVLNMIPEMRMEAQAGLSSRTLFDQLGAMVQEALVRHLGVLHDESNLLRRAARNPLIWFREGIHAILLFPIQLLTWLGLTGPNSVQAVGANPVFRAIATLFTLVSLVGSVVSIVVGWEHFVRIVGRLVQ